MCKSSAPKTNDVSVLYSVCPVFQWQQLHVVQ